MYIKYDTKFISVAVPTDAMRNRECTIADLPRDIENELIDNGSVCLRYNHPLCENVIHFRNYLDLLKYNNTLVGYEGWPKRLLL